MCSAFIGVNKDICDFAKIQIFKKIFKVNGFIYPPEINYKIPNDIVSFFGSSKLSLLLVDKSLRGLRKISMVYGQ